MRVLLTIIPAVSHLKQVVPVAWALQSAGHEVRVASNPEMAEAIVAAGLHAVPLGEEEDLAAMVGAAGTDPRLGDVIDAMDLEADDHDRRIALRNYLLAPFALHYPAEEPPPGSRPFVDELVEFARSWRPDLVLWDGLWFPAPVAARACGAAQGRLLWGLDHVGWARQRLLERLRLPDSGPREDLMAAMMRPTLRRLGVDFDEELLTGQWSIDPTPSGMRLPVDLRYVSMRWVPYNGAAAVPGWLRKPPERPRVCLTLGVSEREFFADSIPLISALLEAAAASDIEVVATLDRAQLAEVGTLPGNVRAVDYLPLSQLLPSCSAIIHHGGSGSFASALTHRVPQLVIPKAGGDYANLAQHAAGYGAGIALDRTGLTAERVTAALFRLLNEPAFQEGADALHADQLAAPSPAELVPVLEKLAAEHAAV
ncbi:activator-dependent family glycosyltransferase [Streptomyces sp. HNM0574]|uniref:activator-dependent family glycosyltransferase n=1 Tax=Streptomyces sp. HNM0574 TaxID=2714954 RepID=UPI00146B3F43|nr:activator-dependent family glycosyltransferase [Streptomyces sp. HNM0574]NLU67855.1 activator-dependent family glycosyltransferase [Streptomyces sp. HNM0574]